MTSIHELHGLGFWFNPIAPSDLPRAEALVGAPWSTVEKAAVLRHLGRGRLYRGLSWCRLHCGIEHLGNEEHTDGVWVWPEGLAHYVDVHDVRLPSELVQAALLDRAAADPPTRTVTLAPWVRWGREQGAWVDLSEPWFLVNDWEKQRLLMEELARELPPGHVLEGERLTPVARRGDCDDVLFVLERDARLAVVHLTWSKETDPRWPSTRILDGWGEWNRDRASHP